VAKKPAPRPEQAAKAITADNDENRKLPQGVAHNLPRKKVVNTLTSVLSHRSKEACGLNLRPKEVEVVEDIDKLDGDNELAVVDYIDDIYSYYKTAEHESRPANYMGSQPEINPKMRAILVDWLVEVSHKFELMPESLYLTIYIVDRFLSMQAVPRREFSSSGWRRCSSPASTRKSGRPRQVISFTSQTTPTRGSRSSAWRRASSTGFRGT